MYKLLSQVDNARYYKLETEISKSVEGKEIEKPTKYIKVSDAHCHIERLAFPFYIAEGFTEEDVINKVEGSIVVDFHHIAGEMTMIIHGGDLSTIRPDNEYLEELIEVNKGGDDIEHQTT